MNTIYADGHIYVQKTGQTHTCLACNAVWDIGLPPDRECTHAYPLDVIRAMALPVGDFDAARKNKMKNWVGRYQGLSNLDADQRNCFAHFIFKTWPDSFRIFESAALEFLSTRDWPVSSWEYEAMGLKMGSTETTPGDSEIACANPRERLTAPSILNSARVHLEDRAALRDQPQGERSMAGTIAAFNAITGHMLSERDGWIFMVCLKAKRACTTARGINDDYEDGAAYFALAGESADA